MSTRVLPFASYFNFSSSRMSDFRGRIQPPPVPITQPGPSQDQGTAALPGVVPSQAPTPRSARRNLFGPIDHDENMKLVQAELSKIAESDSRRWNFDFRNETPLEGRYSWESTKGTVIPPAYEMPNLTARLTQLPITESSTAKTITSNVTKSSSPPSNTAEVSQTSTTSSSDRSNPLRSTLSTVTTATTTVYTTETIQKRPQDVSTIKYKNTREPDTDDNTKSQEYRKDLTTITTQKNTKQTYITDFLKVRKRPRSPSSSSESKAEGFSDTSSSGRTSPPLMKRAKRT